MTAHAGDSPERSVAAHPGRPGHRTVESKLLASIVDSSDDAIFSKTLDATITSWNLGAERMYGYTADEIIGQRVSLLVPADRPDDVTSIMKRIVAGESIDHYETVRRHKDGSLRYVTLTVSPIRDRNGDIVGASTITRISGSVPDALTSTRPRPLSLELSRSIACTIAGASIVWVSAARSGAVTLTSRWGSFSIASRSRSARPASDSSVSSALAKTQRAQGDAVQTSETIMEFNYAVHVTKWFTFQPNVQYVVRPGGTGTIPNAVVLGLQTTINF